MGFRFTIFPTGKIGQKQIESRLSESQNYWKRSQVAFRVYIEETILAAEPIIWRNNSPQLFVNGTAQERYRLRRLRHTSENIAHYN